MIVFNTPWVRLLRVNVRDRQDLVDDEWIEELGDKTHERCFRRDCDGGERSSVLIWIGCIHASKVGVLALRAVLVALEGHMYTMCGRSSRLCVVQLSGDVVIVR